jgi:hypothetical protein
MSANDRFEKALRRNLSELQRVIYYRKALGALWSANPLTGGIDVFVLMDRAFFDQMIGHAIKVFDRNSQSASFWYLLRSREVAIDQFCKSQGWTLSGIETLRTKLKIIRDKTHFHIDTDSVSDPRSVWSAAGIDWNEFDQATRQAFAMLDHLHTLHHGHTFELPNYDGSDVLVLTMLAEQQGLSAAWANRFC